MSSYPDEIENIDDVYESQRSLQYEDNPMQRILAERRARRVEYERQNPEVGFTREAPPSAPRPPAAPPVPERGYLGDVMSGALRGVTRAVPATLETATTIGKTLADPIDWALGQLGVPPETVQKLRHGTLLGTPEIGVTPLVRQAVEGVLSPITPTESQTIPGGIVEAVAQYIVGSKLLGGAQQLGGAARGGVEALGGGARLGEVARQVVTGGAVGTLGFSPRDPRLSNLVDELAQTHPALQNPLTAWLKADETDGEATALLKSAVENTVIGIPTEVVMGLFGAYRASARAARTAAKVEEAELRARGMTRAELAEYRRSGGTLIDVPEGARPLTLGEQFGPQPILGPQAPEFTPLHFGAGPEPTPVYGAPPGRTPERLFDPREFGAGPEPPRPSPQLSVETQEAYHFFKPAAGEATTVDDAVRRVASGDHARFKTIADDVYAQSGVKGAEVQPAIAAGPASVDAGFVAILKDVPDAVARYSGAWLTKLGNLKGVTSFAVDQAGPDALYTVRLGMTNVEQARGAMQELGIGNAIFVREKDGLRAYVPDPGAGALRQADELAKTYPSKVEVIRGRLSADGAATRAEAGRAADAVISGYDPAAVGAGGRYQPVPPPRLPLGGSAAADALLAERGTIRGLAQVIRNDAGIAELLSGVPDPRGVLRDQSGRTLPGVEFALVRAALGAAVGGYTGETPSEKIRNALIGAGLGVVASPALVKRLLRVTKREGPALGLHELPPATQLETAGADNLTQLAHDYVTELGVQTRKTTTRVEGESQAHAHAEAEVIVAGNVMTTESVRKIMPGTAMNDAEAIAVTRILAESGTKLQMLGKQVITTGGNDPLAVKDFLTQLYVHGTLDPKRLGVIAESGRTLKIFDEPVSGLNRYLSQFEELFRNATHDMTPQRMAQTIASFENLDQATVYARKLAKPGWVDIAQEIWINSLLWSPRTLLSNFLGNSATFMWAIPERAIATRLSGGDMAPGEAMAMLSSVPGGIMDGWRAFAKALRTGESGWGSFTKVETRGRAVSADTLEMTGMAGKAMDFLGTWLVRLPGTILTATDDAFKVLNYQAELRAQSVREAWKMTMADGLTGQAAREAMDARINRFMLDPSEGVKRAADRFAATQTFTRDLEKFGQNIIQLQSHPVGRLILPFARTPINIFKYGLERTPLGFFMHEVRADWTAGGARAATAQAKMALGTFTMLGAAYFAAQGTITGGGPKDPKLLRAYRDAGWQPYSVRVGDTYIGFNRLDPIGMLLGLAADTHDAVQNAVDEEGVYSIEQVVTASVVAVMKNFSSKTFVQGLANTLEAIADPENPQSGVKSKAAQMLTSFIPMSGLVRSVEQATDPTLREARSLMDQVQQSIPGWSKSLPPRRNLFGEPIAIGDPRPGSTMSLLNVLLPTPISKVSDDPVRIELAETKTMLRLPTAKIDGVLLTPEEQDRWAVLMGTHKFGGVTLHERLSKLVQSQPYQREGDERRGLMLKEIVDDYRQVSQQQLLKESHDLRTEIENTRRARAGVRAGVATQAAPRAATAGAAPSAAATTNLVRGLTQ